MQLEQFMTLPALAAAGDLAIVSSLTDTINPDELTAEKRDRFATLMSRIVVGANAHPGLVNLTNLDILNLMLDRYAPVQAPVEQVD